MEVEGSLQWPVLTPDGRSLVAVQRIPTLPMQVVRVSLDDGKKVVTLLSASNLGSSSWPGWPRVSPDGRLVAFADSWEVYVRPLEGAGTLQVTGSGGWSPAWGPDSRHLYLAAATISGSPSSERHPPWPSSAVASWRGFPYSCEDFDIAPDGKTFVVVVPASGRSDVLVAAHWTGELRRTWSQGARAEAAP